MTPVSAVSSLRVLTINTHKGFTFFNRKFILHELRDAIRSVAADLVFLQEVQGAHEGHAPRWKNWPSTPHYEFLADTLWPQFAYGRNAVYPLGHHGNAVLSKWPILHSENRDVSIEGPEPRGLLHCILGVPGLEGGLHAICVHLGLQESHRQRQLELLCGMVNDEIPSHAPLLVAGDFNDWRHRAHRILSRCAGLTEVFQRLHGRSARTFPAHLPLLRLDRIYARGLNVIQAQRLSSWSRLSDHLGLTATFEPA